MQAVAGLCSGDVQALPPADAIVLLHNVTFRIEDVALPAGPGVWLAQSLAGLNPPEDADPAIVLVHTNITLDLGLNADVPYLQNKWVALLFLES